MLSHNGIYDTFFKQAIYFLEITFAIDYTLLRLHPRIQEYI